MIRAVNIYVVAQVESPWAWNSLVMGEPIIVEDPMVPTIVGGIHLVLAVLWFIYFMGFIWRKRLGICMKTVHHSVAWSRELQFSAVQLGISTNGLRETNGSVHTVSAQSEETTSPNLEVKALAGDKGAKHRVLASISSASMNGASINGADGEMEDTESQPEPSSGDEPDDQQNLV